MEIIGQKPSLKGGLMTDLDIVSCVFWFGVIVLSLISFWEFK